MKFINLLSLSLFFIFLASYLLKLYILYMKNGIKANMLAKGGKSKEINKVELLVKITTLVWGILWLIFSIFELKVKFFLLTALQWEAIRYIGIAFCIIGVSIFITAMISMKSSWRVGIDNKTETSLITTGIYKYSRNPAFVGFDTMFLGFAFTFPSLLTLMVALLNIFAIDRLILQEEKHLSSAYKDAYLEYRAKTPRYFIK